MPTNSAYLPDPELKRKTKKAAKPKATRTPARKESKPAATASKPKASQKPKRVRLTPEERQERARALSAEYRRKIKKSGLCED